MIKFGVFLGVALASMGAQAGVIDLGAIMGGANVYTAGDFKAISSDVEGAIVSGGNVTIQNYAVNKKDRAAYAGYSIVAGGDISLTSGSIHNGPVYAGGAVTTQSAATPPRSTVNPVDFSSATEQFKDIAAGLSLVGATGTVERLYSANKLIGSGKGGVDIFNVSADFLNGGNNWVLSGLTANQTLIFNISGKHGGFTGGMQPLSGYNVLFNFFEAETVDVKGILGSVLAPYATVVPGYGVIKGQVIAGTWNSSVQVDAENYWKAVDVPGFELVKNDPPVESPVEVPEPGTLTLMMAGLLGGIALRRRRA
ncbi:choice-of-anchor A family protein [Massilia sp. CFBP9012]|uniref:choice-of-anchor A family protein n=1 Tax=Massilia sp. CFBP9012 TaxID=3096531 RepID=UPI002A69B695|nr:choice-of-anchor A family protein [Massilia sp. CFBP9012]MDY0977929.1 choice-of-anchor A family protein [Massilia sp. CFBP9012]